MTRMAHTPRTWEVPVALVAAGAPEHMTLDEMWLVAGRADKVGRWANKVLACEDDKILDELLDGSTVLPRGIIEYDDDDQVCTGLLSSAGKVWRGDDWTQSTSVPETIDLPESEVAFVARALLEGHTAVIFRPVIPVAFIAAAPAPATKPPKVGAPTGAPDLPADAIPIALTDPVDTSAVLELLAVAPGPKIYRRNDGKWYEDAGFLPLLTSVNPPPIVKLTPEQVGAVSTQVDAATKGVPFKVLAVKDRDLYQPATAVHASAYLQMLQNEADQLAVDRTLGLLAVAGRELSPTDARATERLKRYWTVGAGGAKIRWFTPGAWTRCYHHAIKFMPPYVAKGWCTNLGQRLGGYGIADHVGEGAKRAIKRAVS